MSWRRLGVASLEALVGAGVFYGAATSEAVAMKDEQVVVVGGGNSAGQAALDLASYAAQVTMLVRGLTLKDRTSGATETVPATALFILIGAEPHTGWLPGTLRRDRWGFLVTGNDLPADGRPPARSGTGRSPSAWSMST